MEPACAEASVEPGPGQEALRRGKSIHFSIRYLMSCLPPSCPRTSPKDAKTGQRNRGPMRHSWLPEAEKGASTLGGRVSGAGSVLRTATSISRTGVHRPAC
jgi:hypothetical protein